MDVGILRGGSEVEVGGSTQQQRVKDGSGSL